MVEQRADLTFKHNRTLGRHGWLRLTPAYSVKIVQRFLDPSTAPVLDPFSGTGTTGLLCAQAGVACDLVEINPFLTWLAEVKTRSYEPEVLRGTQALAQRVAQSAAVDNGGQMAWVPPIHHIERWWRPDRLRVLAQLFERLHTLGKTAPPASLDLLRIAFCRLLIEWSNAAFNHQSLSFRDESAQLALFAADERADMLASFIRIVSQIVQDAWQPVQGTIQVVEGDARQIAQVVRGPYAQVITSPPYPNRISYIRELRPYMYWLGFLSDARQAGELDWQAIGGTWGAATSRLAGWKPEGVLIEHHHFYDMLEQIADRPNAHGSLLANYVHRYFADILTHFTSLKTVLAPGARVVYIVGNAKFYEVIVPVPELYAAIMEQCGFSTPQIEVLRKRNSKKELFEYAVTAHAPSI